MLPTRQKGRRKTRWLRERRKNPEVCSPCRGGFISLIHIAKYFLAKMLYGRASRGVNKAFPLPNMAKL
jgi:hypothetical protein